MVQPVLASSLLLAGRAALSEKHTKRVLTGFADIDEILRGGIALGSVTAISGEHGTGKTLLALHLLVSQLLASNTAQVAVIDTTGNFDVLRLYQIIIYHIKSKQNAERAAATSNVNPKLFYDDTPVAKLYALASQMLDRVKVMRVFDFVGVSEAIGELREGVRVAAKDQEMATAWAAEPTQKTHVADSQADEDDEDIMLFDGAGDVEASSSETPKLDSVSLIIIDNLTSVINPIIKSNYVQGQAILISFMRSLASFAQDADVAALVLNNAASSRSANVSFPGLAKLNHGADVPASTFISDPHGQPGFTTPDHVSIFASTTAQPSLGKSFGSLVDYHLLISMLPKRKKDAEIIVGGQSGRAEVVHVVEVLNDRDGNGHGRWAAFEIAEAGTQLRVPS